MNNATNTKYTFSGHESFPCKTLWLKKGFDFVKKGRDFNASDAVVHLGVGKNMVASIRYWMRAFGLLEDSELSTLAKFLFNDEHGRDCYLEDIATLQVLHFNLVHLKEASLYNMFFCGLQRERSAFDRDQVLNYVSLRMAEEGKQNLFNPNTVKKDIAVLLQNYSLPRKPQGNEDFSSLLIDLDLIRENREDRGYYFNTEGKRQIQPAVFLYALLTIQNEQKEKTIPFEIIQDEIGLPFCMKEIETIALLRSVSAQHPDLFEYNDIAGIRQVQFVGKMGPMKALEEYYHD